MGHYGIAHARKLIVLSRARPRRFMAWVYVCAYSLSSRDAGVREKARSLRECERVCERKRGRERGGCVFMIFSEFMNGHSHSPPLLNVPRAVRYNKKQKKTKKREKKDKLRNYHRLNGRYSFAVTDSSTFNANYPALAARVCITYL